MKKRLKETQAQVFSCELCEIFNNLYFCRTPPVVAFIEGNIPTEEKKTS